MTEVRELDSAPSMRVLYPKAGLGAARGLFSRLPGVGGGASELPDVEVRLGGFEVDRDHLAEYNRVCGFRLSDVLPPTYPHILAFPLQMELMTRGDFPFAVVGLVHIRNRIKLTRAIRADERLDLRVWVEDLRPHEKGMQFEMRAEASVLGDEVVYRSWSTYLRRGESSGSARKEPSEREEPRRAQAQWKLPGDTGRSYAAVSGDSNPIHMHALSARLFGMPSAIAHGMYMKARCLAALEGHLPDALEADVRFKLPVRIPGTVSFASWPEGDGRGFSVRDAKNEKPHLSGSARPA
jgi:acyl dehydratase